MRAKVVLSASVLALAVLIPVVYFHFKSASRPPAAEAVSTDDSTNAAPSTLPPILKRASTGSQDQGRGVAVQEDNDAALNHDDYVTKRKADLYEMGMSQNPASLKKILTEVHNTDPEIRKAALTAVLDFGSPDAIPALQNELAWATDLQEKLDIQKAIEFLQLPSFGAGDAVTQQ